MPQREGEVDYKYEDYASEMATHRLPQTSALVNQTMQISLESQQGYLSKRQRARHRLVRGGGGGAANLLH